MASRIWARPSTVRKLCEDQLSEGQNGASFVVYRTGSVLQSLPVSKAYVMSLLRALTGYTGI